MTSNTVQVIRDEVFAECDRILADRYKSYGDNFIDTAKIMNILLPSLNLRTEADHGRYQFILWIIGKLSRYCNNFNEGGHTDSLLDLINYAALLRRVDIFYEEERKNET